MLLLKLPRSIVVSTGRQHISYKCLSTASANNCEDSNQQQSESKPKLHYDIIIAGGGMVGTTLACTLGKNKKFSSKKILLLEGGQKSTYKVSDKYSNRVVAINPQTINLFKRIDAWKHITKYGTVKQLHVWDALSDSMINFNHDDMSETVAYIIENDLLLNAVNEEVSGLDNVTVENEAKVKVCSINDNPNMILLENGSCYSCTLLLGCDGANSKVRDAMRAQYLNWSYNQRGVVATLHLKGAEENCVAWQRFLPTGPIALLPLKENMSSLVWSTTPAHADQLLKMSFQDFIDACNDALWKVYKVDSLVGGATKAVDNFLKFLKCPPNAVRQLPPTVCDFVEDSRAAFPLGFGHAAKYVADGVALVGDAAHKIHPLAGQGVNLGFGDIECLNRILGQAVYNGSTLADKNFLLRYETERQRHNVPTMLAIDGIHRMYNTEFTPLVMLRSIGLQLTQALTPVKRTIIGHASS